MPALRSGNEERGERDVVRRIWILGATLAVFALASLLFYWPALFGGKILLPLDNLWTMPPWVGPPGQVSHNLLISDMILQNYPWKLILQQALRQRELPLWNPYEMAGLPYLATGQTAVLYPLSWLFLVLGPLRAFGWYSALHQFLAAGLTYLFLRRLGVGRVGAMAAGFTFAFCFFLTVSYIWPMVLGSAIWLPLALWSLVGLAQAVENRKISRALAIDLPIGVAAIALGVLGGHLEITFYATFAVGLYALFVAGRFWLRAGRGPSGRFFALACVVIGLGVTLASIQMLPFLGVLQSNNRQGDTTYQQVISYALPHRQVLGLLMPDFFGNPATHTYFDLTTLKRTPVGDNALHQPTDPPHTIFWGTKNYVEAGGYVGVVPIVLALAGIFLASHRDRWFFIGLATVSVLLAFGTPLYALIYYGLPFFSQLRTPFRWLYPLDFSLAVLAGMGADWAMAKAHERVKGWRHAVALALSWGALGVGIAGLAALAASFLLRSHSVAFAGRILARDAELQRAFASGAMLYSYEFRNLAIFFALLASGGALLVAARLIHPARKEVFGGSRGKAVVGALILGCIVVDLFFFGTRFASKESPAILSQRVDLSAALPPDLAGPRVVSYGDPEVLRSNLNVLLGIPSVGGYDTIISSRYVRLWSLIEPPVDLPYNQIGRLHQVKSVSSPILDLLGVRYVLTEQKIDSPAVHLTGEIGGIRIYERPSALPRAFVVGQAEWVPNLNAAFHALASPGFAPGRQVVLEGTPSPGGGHGTAEIDSYLLDQVVVKVNVAGAPAWLVLSDANAPGWEAQVDGKTEAVQTADGDLRAVYLKPGAHRVVFQYKPIALRIGAYASFISLIVLGLIGTWPLWRRLMGHYTGQAERVLRNATLPMFTSFLNKGIDFGFAILMLRMLGVDQVGAYTFAVVAVGYFEIVTNFGLNALIIREVSRDRDRGGRYLADAIAIRLALCALAVPLAAALILFGHKLLGLDSRTVVAFTLLALALIPGNFSATLSALFYAWERIEIPATISVATSLVRVTLGTVALLAGAGIIGLAAIALALNLVLVIVFIVVARRTLRVKLSGPVPADLPTMLSESFPLLINHVLATVFFKIDVVLLQALRGSDTVGYYAAAYKWVDGTLIIPSTFTFAVYPVLSRFAQQKGAGLRTAYEMSVRVLLTIGIPISVVIAFLSGDLILILGGRAYYPQSAMALAILIWFLPFSYLNGLTQYALIAVNRQRFITVAFAIAVIFNLAANAVFIPRYGLYAASAVTVLSEVVLMIPFLVAVQQSIGAPRWLMTAGKPVLAGLLMAVVAWLGRPFEPHVALVLALGVYLVALRALHVFSSEELAALQTVIAPLRRNRVAIPAEA